MVPEQSNPKRQLLPQPGRVPVVNSPGPWAGPETQTLATRDPEVIRQWARVRQAVPATGLQTASGPSTAVSVNDGGAGVRFNYPGVSVFRDISWEEWLTYFRDHDLLFVFEERTAEGTMSHRYRLVRPSDWEGQFETPPRAAPSRRSPRRAR
jgi:hypothetical protein